MIYQPTPLKQFFHNVRRGIAKSWITSRSAVQIGITGSQGKTNTAMVIAKTLKNVGKTVETDVNLDTTYNIPITALRATPWTQFIVFEIGIDHPGEMDSHLEIVRPKIAVVTGISPVHTDSEHMGSLENLIREKRKLIEALPTFGYAILNYDDINVRTMAAYTKAKVLWYGTERTNCQVWADNIVSSLDGTSFKLHDNLSPSDGTYAIQTQLIGSHHIYTLMPAYLTLYAVSQLLKKEFKVEPFLHASTEVTPLYGRMNVEKSFGGITVLNDSLRANPTSTAAGLHTLSEIGNIKGKKIAVLAEMGELEHPEESHREIGRIFARLTIDFLIAIGPAQRFVAEEAIKNGVDQSRIFWVPNAIKAGETLKKIASSNDLVYLKGSLLRHVERVMMVYSGKNVGCDVTVCPFYHHCPDCKYVNTGYQNTYDLNQQH